MTSPLLIRPAREGDLPRLTEIYNHYILTTSATFDTEPFTVERRRKEWWDHYSDQGPHRILVADLGGEVQGLAWSSQFRPKAAYRSSVETSVYCAPEATGKGLGTLLYTELFAILEGLPLHRAIACITQPNEASMALHRRFGFKPVAMLTEVGFKLGRYWDVAYLERPLGR